MHTSVNFTTLFASPLTSFDQPAANGAVAKVADLECSRPRLPWTAIAAQAAREDHTGSLYPSAPGDCAVLRPIPERRPHRPRDRGFVDSPLEVGVRCELVSKVRVVCVKFSKLGMVSGRG
jgi:hypothetical protein